MQIPDEKIQFWSIQLLKGIHFLHSKNIWHRDIKPANIFLHRNELVLGDLGLARNQQQNLNNSLL
jgi:serine/threonine protein kinase